MFSKKKNRDLRFQKTMCANNIFYILELNKYDREQYKEIFNKVLKMKFDKENGDYF